MHVSVIDYGASNLLSVCRALQHCGADVRVVREAGEVRAADRLVLPGVGAFATCMSGLRALDLVDAVAAYGRGGRPFLGICLGLQVLFDTGTEFGEHDGLAFVRGAVKPLPETDDTGRLLKVPHIGWAPLIFPEHRPAGRRSVLDGLPDGTAVYFVHSFYAVPDDEADVLASARHGGHLLTAAVQKDNLIGTQFHPEKSGPAGLQILTNFLRAA